MKPPGAVRAIGRTLLAMLAFIAASATQLRAEELPGLGAAIGETTVSGLSSGAYMAGQMQMAHARIVKGAALIAGGPYGCSESLFADAMFGPGTMFINASKAVNGCMLDGLKLWGIPDPEQLAARARRLAAEKRIDDISEVVTDRVYLFSGREDHTVVPSIVSAAERYYRAVGVPPSSIRYVTDIGSGHGLVTAGRGLACERTAQPFVVDCNYDQAGDFLGHLLGNLRPAAAKLSSAVETFDQGPYTAGLSDHSMATHGALYVPADCKAAPGCRIHVAFHGCAQSRATAGDAALTDTGLLGWADTNRLVVLFPQVAPGPLNPQGCWDWWGYTGRAYLTREGAQIVAVHRMLQRLASR